MFSDHRSYKSPIWVYFDVLKDEKFVKCKLCHVKLSRGGVGKSASTSPMLNHMKNIHAYEFSQLNIKRKPQNSEPFSIQGSVTTGVGPPLVNLPHNHVPDMHALARARGRSTILEPESSPSAILGLSVDLGPADLIPLHSEPEMEAETSQSLLKPTTVTRPTSTSVPRPVSPQTPESEMCLRWNSHHANMSTVIPALMDDEKYVDVSLMAEGQIIKCHKLILSSCSNYFDEMLKNTHSNQQTIIFLRDIQFWQIKALVDFMYRGEVNVDQSKLESLLKAAEDLQIKGLAGKTPKKDPETTESAPAIPPQLEDPEPEIKSESEYMDDLIEDDEDEEYFPHAEKRGKYKKNRKRKVSAPPDPSLLKHVKINLRGTKSRPNIKQPKFFSPDYPEYDPDRCVSPPKVETEPAFHIDNIKIEPIDIEVPQSPTFLEMNSLMDKSISESCDVPLKTYGRPKEIKTEKTVEVQASTSKEILGNFGQKAIIVKCKNVQKLIDDKSAIQKILESDKPLSQIRVRSLPTTETMLKKFATTQLTSILKKGDTSKHIILKKVGTKPTILRHSLPAKTKEFTTEVQDSDETEIKEKISLLAKTRKELEDKTEVEDPEKSTKKIVEDGEITTE